MFYDLLETYRNNSEGDIKALDSYSLPDGLYLRLHLDGEEMDELVVDKNTTRSGSLYNWFKISDFYSRLIEMNKPIDPKKKIHSNNIYSVFFKRDTMLANESEAPALGFIESIERYYDVLANSNQELKNSIAPTGIKEIDPKIIEENKKYVLSQVSLLAKKVLSHKFKKNIYIKLFFNVDAEMYRQESMRYLIPRIFNSNDHNLMVNGDTYGLSNMNMSLNAKKPYLEHKTTSFEVPFRISTHDALDSKNLVEWLANQKDDEGKSILSGYLPVNEDEQFALSDKISDQISGSYLHMEKGIKTIIDDYDFLPGITNVIKPFELKNYLRLKDFNTDVITRREKLEVLTDEWLYNKNLINNYYNDKPKARTGFSTRQVDLLIKSKTAMLNFFRKCDTSALQDCFDKVSLGLIKQAILINTYPRIELTNIAPAMNLRLSMLRYFRIGGKEDMGDIIQPLWDIMKKKVVDGSPDEQQTCSNDIEFYYATGQLTRYLISLSQAQKINYNALDPLLNAKDSNRLKTEIYNLLKKYSHAVDLNYKRINTLLAMVMGYHQDNPDEVIHDAFIAGLASRNIIYYVDENKKKEEAKS